MHPRTRPHAESRFSAPALPCPAHLPVLREGGLAGGLRSPAVAERGTRLHLRALRCPPPRREIPWCLRRAGARGTAALHPSERSLRQRRAALSTAAGRAPPLPGHCMCSLSAHACPACPTRQRCESHGAPGDSVAAHMAATQQPRQPAGTCQRAKPSRGERLQLASRGTASRLPARSPASCPPLRCGRTTWARAAVPGPDLNITGRTRSGAK
jgi:hypothetical protein